MSRVGHEAGAVWLWRIFNLFAGSALQQYFQIKAWKLLKYSYFYVSALQWSCTATILTAPTLVPAEIVLVNMPDWKTCNGHQMNDCQKNKVLVSLQKSGDMFVVMVFNMPFRNSFALCEMHAWLNLHNEWTWQWHLPQQVSGCVQRWSVRKASDQGNNKSNTNPQHSNIGFFSSAHVVYWSTSSSGGCI